jgi:hypothetical protein
VLTKLDAARGGAVREKYFTCEHFVLIALEDRRAFAGLAATSQDLPGVPGCREAQKREGSFRTLGVS